MEEPIWRPALPLELQLHILSLSISPTASELDYPLAARLGRVNSSWCGFIDPKLYNTVVIRHQSRYPALFHRESFAAREVNPIRYIQRLILLVPPPQDWRAFDTFWHMPQGRGFNIPEVSFDMASVREQFSVVRRLPRGTHVQKFANQALGLYQLLLDFRTTSYHLFISSPMLENDDPSLWAEVMAGHLAAFKMIDNVKSLTIEGDLYLALLPKCIKGWAQSESWQLILGIVKEDNEVAMPTLIDETCLEKVSL